ncbi:chorismate synthase [Eubacterium ruminantium]|jgi:chorismate synthase|uniref:Chorismate synthase n=1 Tax=Eubacterium ruminantium TaxID=42322 RepID=A0A1T4LX87_9FIRM|nr:MULTISPECIES: chorismate synthase [Eubacterium]MCR5367610.1 chorismate synthase [Eubacterium sp.]SCW38927.1 chorismate synthase [Eubacterium ruminantium]SDM43364.1 chorismate synthase [Eubacterium ruminantium]SJZ59074.1 chorismate synthase [Eubacterium ruminantium]
MAGSVFGNILKCTTWGESHGPALGAVLDGCPAGLAIDEDYIQMFMDRRKPGQSDFSTKRNESDKVMILSGVFEGKTTGTPISLMINNNSQISKDYSNIAECYRPGHADYTFDEKYGFRDYRGGGRSSGRETAGRVAAGAIAIKLLSEFGINFTTFVESVGDISIDYNKFDKNEISNNKLYMPDKDAAEKAAEYLKNVSADKDSSGAVVKCIIDNVPAGLGDPVFDKLDARLASAIMSIGAVKSFEVGNGKAVSKLKGSENNDEFYIDNGEVRKRTNNSGGILGGISDGSSIILTAAFKPTPSIYKSQKTVNNKHEDIELEIKGRHDPIIAPRAVVVVEAMSALVIADALLMNCSSKLDNLKKIYEV